ncbi:MAG: hypothetical protein AABZ33_12780 [Chloroflexota bacterium]
MSDDFESLLERWLRDRGRTDRDVLAALAGHVAVLPPRRRRRGPSLVRAAAIVLAVGLGAAYIGTVARPSSDEPAGASGFPSPGSGGTVAPSPTLDPTVVASPADLEAPDWARDLIGQLECDAEPAPIGYERGEGPRVGREGTASPSIWLYGVQDVDLPLSGWRIEPTTPWEDGLSHFTRHVATVDGRLKAIILMEGKSTQGGPGSWYVTAFRACPAVEFDPSAGRTSDNAPWFDATGVPTSTVRTSTGPGHCGWESTVWLWMGDQLFLRDPLGIFAGKTIGRYREETQLPQDAVQTGYRNLRWHLYRSADQDTLLMLTPTGGVEVWPRSSDPFIGCV